MNFMIYILLFYLIIADSTKDLRILLTDLLRFYLIYGSIQFTNCVCVQNNLLSTESQVHNSNNHLIVFVVEGDSLWEEIDIDGIE